MKQSNCRILGRGLDSLLHVVESEEETTIKPSAVLSSPTEHPDSLTPLDLRLKARQRLEKLSSRPRHGIRAARHYLDKLRREDGRISLDLDISKVDLTSSTMLQLASERIASQTHHSFFGVSIWK